MFIPILAQGPFLVASVQVALVDTDLAGLRDRLLEKAAQRRASGVVIDVTALDVIDSFSTHTLRELAAILELRGVETVIVGVQPDVAMAMVQLGLHMGKVATALDLDEGLAYLHTAAAAEAGTSG